MEGGKKGEQMDERREVDLSGSLPAVPKASIDKLLVCHSRWERGRGERCVHLESRGEERSSETESEERDHVETEFGTIGLICNES